MEQTILPDVVRTKAYRRAAMARELARVMNHEIHHSTHSNSADFWHRQLSRLLLVGRAAQETLAQYRDLSLQPIQRVNAQIHLGRADIDNLVITGSPVIRAVSARLVTIMADLRTCVEAITTKGWTPLLSIHEGHLSQAQKEEANAMVRISLAQAEELLDQGKEIERNTASADLLLALYTRAAIHLTSTKPFLPHALEMQSRLQWQPTQKNAWSPADRMQVLLQNSLDTFSRGGQINLKII